LSELENKYRTELNEEEFSNLKSAQELEEWLRRSTMPTHRSASERVRRKASSEWARSLPVRAFRRTFQRVIAIPLFMHYLPLRVTGLEHLRNLRPPVIIVANHSSHLDAPAVFAALPVEWQRCLAPAMGLDVFRPYFEPLGFKSTEVWWAGLGYVL